MVKEHQVQYGDDAQVFVTVTVDREQIKEEYDRLVDEYCKKVQIKGFRRGKVPPSILIRKFGDSLLGETQEKIVQQSLSETLETVERKPLPYSTPVPTDGPPEAQSQSGESLEGSPQKPAEQPEQQQAAAQSDEQEQPAEEEAEAENAVTRQRDDQATLPPLSLEEDYRYTVVYDTFPQIELGEYKGIEVQEPQWEVTEEDIERELKAIQEQNALVVEKKEDVVAEGDVVTIDYCELNDDDSEKPRTQREGFVFEVGSGYNLYGIDQDILGMHTDEQRIIPKSYDADYAQEELRNRSVRVKVTVTAIKEKKLPEIDDELAQDISDKYETMEDLKADIRRRMEQTAKNRTRERMVNEIMAEIAKRSTIPLPRSMVLLELTTLWRQFVSRTGGDEERTLKLVEASGQSVEKLYQEWTPQAVARVTIQLIQGELFKREQIEVSEEDLQARIKEFAEESNMEQEEAKKQLEDSGYLDQLRSAVQVNKLSDFLLEQATVKPGEKLSYLDLTRGN